jgi:hypothetical protein
MTVLVGIKCTDGVVIGADSIATSAHGVQALMRLPTDKIVKVSNTILMASTGAVGLNQRFEAIIMQCWSKGAFKEKTVECGRRLAEAAVQDFRSTNVLLHGQHGYQFGALVAAPIDGEAQLFEFGTTDFQPEVKRDKLFCAAMGSGQNLAEPFLGFVSKVLWGRQPPTVQDGIFGATWALQHCIDLAPGSVGLPIRIATLKKEGGDWRARIMDADETKEHEDAIRRVEARIGEIPKQLIEEAEPSPPPQAPSGNERD